MILKNLTTFILLAFPISVISGNLSQNQRDTILKGMFNYCIESMSSQFKTQVGSMRLKQFCSCYADELANNLTQNQFNAMIVNPDTGESKTPPGIQQTVQKAYTACQSNLSD